MTTIPVDFQAVYLTPTKSGFEFTSQETYQPFHMRVEIEATSRDAWDISNIYLVDSYKIVGENRWGEVLQTLEGVPLAAAMKFITGSDKTMDLLQDKVNQEIIPDAEWRNETFCGGV